VQLRRRRFHEIMMLQRGCDRVHRNVLSRMRLGSQVKFLHRRLYVLLGDRMWPDLCLVVGGSAQEREPHWEGVGIVSKKTALNVFHCSHRTLPESGENASFVRRPISQVTKLFVSAFGHVHRCFKQLHIAATVLNYTVSIVFVPTMIPCKPQFRARTTLTSSVHRLNLAFAKFELFYAGSAIASLVFQRTCIGGA